MRTSLTASTVSALISATTFLLGCATAARSDIVKQIYKGTITTIVADEDAPLSYGMPVTAVFVFDTSHGIVSISPKLMFVEGGSSENPPVMTPSLGASVTFGGTTYRYAGEYYAQLLSKPDFTRSTVNSVSTFSGASNSLYALASGSQVSLPVTISQSYSNFGPFQDQHSYGYFDFTRDAPDAGGVLSTRDAAHFDVVSVQQIVGVPEPVTWAIMLIGLGGVGAAMRVSRRTRSGAVAKA
jgi:hypothetical protein